MTTLSPIPTRAPVASLRVSDAEREQTVAILRDAWLTGRLTDAEFEARCAEAWGAAFVDDLWWAVRELPVPAVAPTLEARPRSGGGVALALSIVGLTITVLTFGLASLPALPFSLSGWALGRAAGGREASSAGRAAQVIGIVGAVIQLVLLAGCGAVVALSGR